jgi:exopolysaccharide production protein ExoZ
MTLYTLQLLRFIASLLVLFFHLNIIDSGYKGVDIFFVISGFVMYFTLFIQSSPKAFKFIIHRLSKIFFLYWVALILLYIITPYKIDVSCLKTFLLIPGHYPVLGVSWSLSYELYFYCLISITAYIVPRKFHYLLFFVLLSVSSLITLVDSISPVLKGTLINFLVGTHLWEFLLGVLSAFLSVKYYKTFSATFTLTITLFSSLLFFLIGVPYNNSVSYIIYGLLSFFIICSVTAYEIKAPLNKKVSGLFKVLGDASYAIYLFGPLVAIIITPGSNLLKMGIIITTIVFSVLFNKIVESNFLIWSRKTILALYDKKTMS